jgi:uncharacterized repeat protein (TIGR03803 family)
VKPEPPIPAIGRTLLVLAITVAGNAWAANTETVLHAFAVDANDGSSLYSSLTIDPSGNLYGTTVDGGTHGAGIVFRLSSGSGRRWQETVLYDFAGGPDGANPHATLALDSAGNLYVTTVNGGTKQKNCSSGCGVVFDLTPVETGQWKETGLHEFKGTNGSTPYAGVVLDAAGNLYGATLGGVTAGLGTVYKLASGSWTDTVLHNFTGKPDGKTADATPILDRAGNVYGTTYSGGAHNQGSVYEVTTQPTVTGRVLYCFKGGADGDEPFAGVIFDASGDL